MPIEFRPRDGGGDRLVLTICPCGYEFDPGEDRCTHIASHDPEDFGLSPRGEIPDDHGTPVLGVELEPEIADRRAGRAVATSGGDP